ncbi:unnamed protein product [Cunninghamella blakesleeana]
MLEPVWDDITWQSKQPDDFIDEDDYYGVDKANLAASLIHKGYVRNQKIKVTVDIQHFQPYQRENGLTISLVRYTRILCKEKAYLLSPIVINSTKADINIQRISGQTITVSLLIPKHISPTINLNARLMQIDYRIEVKAELDEHQQYPSPTIINHQQSDVQLSCMKVELPIVIGTLPSINATPPDQLDPKFVKGVNHFIQINEPRQQPYQQQQKQRSSNSIRPSTLSSPLDLLSLSLPKSPFSKNNRYTKLKRNSNPIFPSSSVYQSQVSLPPSVPPHHNHLGKYYKTIKTIDESDEEDNADNNQQEDHNDDEEEDDEENEMGESYKCNSPTTTLSPHNINLRLSLGASFGISPDDIHISRSPSYVSTSATRTNFIVSTINESKDSVSIIQTESSTTSSHLQYVEHPSNQHRDTSIPSSSSSSTSSSNQINNIPDMNHDNLQACTKTTSTNIRQTDYSFRKRSQDSNEELLVNNNHDRNEMNLHQTASALNTPLTCISFNKQNSALSLSPNEYIYDDNGCNNNKNNDNNNNNNNTFIKKEQGLKNQQDMKSSSSIYSTSSSSEISVDAGRQQKDSNHKELSIGIFRQTSVFSNYRQTNISPLPSPLENKSMIKEEDDNSDEEKIMEDIYKPESSIDKIGIQGTYTEPIKSPTTSTKSSQLNQSNKNERLVLVDESNNETNSIPLEGEEQEVQNGRREGVEEEEEESLVFDKPHENPIVNENSDLDSDSDDEDFVTILARREKEIKK